MGNRVVNLPFRNVVKIHKHINRWKWDDILPIRGIVSASVRPDSASLLGSKQVNRCVWSFVVGCVAFSMMRRERERLHSPQNKRWLACVWLQINAVCCFWKTLIHRWITGTPFPRNPFALVTCFKLYVVVRRCPDNRNTAHKFYGYQQIYITWLLRSTYSFLLVVNNTAPGTLEATRFRL